VREIEEEGGEEEWEEREVRRDRGGRRGRGEGR
jgi:hypothetical protein